MIGFSLSEAAAVVQGSVQGRDAVFSSVSTDTRSLRTGDLFIALQGPNFDGHDYIGIAAQQGARGALVSREVKSAMPLLRVRDTRIAMGQLAAAWREKSAASLVGITGSNGKTTVKEMLASILAQQHSVLATRGNLNNDIGMPLTLMGLQDEQYAVIEMGASHPGEIAYLSRIAHPDIALLTNAGRAHLEGFGSVEGVARAKGEILQGLSPKGTFIFNADDVHAPLWRRLAASCQKLGFGLDESAEVRSPADSYHLQWREGRFEARFAVEMPGGCFEVSLQLGGEHNRMNALAATAAALALGIPEKDIRDGLAALAPVRGRLCAITAATGSRLVDDSYNANPDSVAAAIAVLAAMPGRRTLVLGDLGELGDGQVALHRELGVLAAKAGLERLLTLGPLSRYANQSFTGEKHHFEDRAGLLDYLQTRLDTDDSVLIKGSRASAMDRVVAALEQEPVEC